jgi:hypothetical protein
MNIASRRFAHRILTALGLAACAQTAGCLFQGSGSCQPTKEVPARTVEVDEGCWATIQNEEETAVVCLPKASLGGACAGAADPHPKLESALQKQLFETDQSLLVSVACATGEGKDASGDTCCYGVVILPESAQCNGDQPSEGGGEP